MNEERFRVNDLVKYDYSEIGEYIDENHTDRPLRNDILVKLLNELYEENQLLRNFKEKSDKFTEEVENFFEKHDIDTVNFDLIDEEFELYQKENEQLKERNNRQCKQLDDLYRLIEEKDWRALSDIIDDFKKADEQLQKEWGIYGDIE